MKTQEVENVVVKMTGDASSYQKMINEVEKSTEAAAKIIDTSLGKIDSAGKSIDNFAKSLSTVSTVFGAQNQVKGALDAIGNLTTSIAPMMGSIAGSGIQAVSGLWESFKNVGSTIAALPTTLETVQRSLKAVTEVDIGDYFKQAVAGGAAVAKLSLTGVADAFAKVTSSVKAAWVATNAFSAKYLTFTALAAGVSSAMVIARTATVSMVTTAVSSITRVAAAAKAAITSTATTAATATAATATAGGKASLATIGASLLTGAKSAGVWGLAIAAAGVAVYGTWKAITNLNTELKETEKRIQSLTMMDIEAYNEETEALKETANSFFLKEARDSFIKQQVGEVDKDLNLKKLRGVVDDTEKSLSKISWWKKLFGTQEAKEAKAAYNEAQSAYTKFGKDKYDVGEPDDNPLSEEDDSRTIQFEIERYKYKLEQARQKLADTSKYTKTSLFDYLLGAKAKAAQSEVDNIASSLEAAQKRLSDLENAPHKARLDMNRRLEQATAELQKQAFLVGKTGAEALAYEAKLKGVSEWRLNNLLGAEDRLKKSQGAVKFQKDWEEMLKSLKKEDELSGLTGLEHKIAALIKQGKEFNRSIPIDKLKELSNIARMHEADASRNKEIDKATALTERLKGPAAKLRDELEELSTMYRDNVGLDSETYIKALEELRKKLIEAEKATRSAYDTNTKFNTSLVGSAEAISKMEDYRNEGFGNKLGIQNSFLVNSPLRETSKDYIDVLKDIRDILKLEKEAAGIKISPTDLLFSNS